MTSTTKDIKIELMVNFTFWQDGEYFIGFLNDFPDYQTQGMSMQELQENLKGIYSDVSEGRVPFARKTMKLAL